MPPPRRRCVCAPLRRASLCPRLPTRRGRTVSEASMPVPSRRRRSPRVLGRPATSRSLALATSPRRAQAAACAPLPHLSSRCCSCARVSCRRARSLARGGSSRPGGRQLHLHDCRSCADRYCSEPPQASAPLTMGCSSSVVAQPAPAEAPAPLANTSKPPPRHDSDGATAVTACSPTPQRLDTSNAAGCSCRLRPFRARAYARSAVGQLSAHAPQTQTRTRTRSLGRGVLPTARLETDEARCVRVPPPLPRPLPNTTHMRHVSNCQLPAPSSATTRRRAGWRLARGHKGAAEDERGRGFCTRHARRNGNSVDVAATDTSAICGAAGRRGWRHG